MRPHYVRDLDAYLDWLGQLIDWSGGRLENPPYLHLQDAYAAGRAGGIDERAVLIQEHHLRFPDGSRLVFQMLLVETLDTDTLEPIDVEVATFKFQYLSADDDHVWRCENHEGHEDEEGRPAHFHPANGEPWSCDDMDLDDALKRIYEGATSG
jgi:hypothetical protein